MNPGLDYKNKKPPNLPGILEEVTVVRNVILIVVKGFQSPLFS